MIDKFWCVFMPHSVYNVCTCIVCVVGVQLHEYNLQQMQDISRRRAAALDYHRQEYERTHPHHRQQQQQQQRSIYQTDSDSPAQPRFVSDDEEGEDEID